MLRKTNPLLVATLVGCAASTHPVTTANLGTVRSSVDLEAVVDQPGPVELQTIVAADWEVDREGVINFDHPKAEEAGLAEGLEPIQIYLHVLRHPKHGTFIVDTGIERALREDPDNSFIQGMVASAMNLELLQIRVDTATWLADQKETLAGVFLTHLHLDHISGLPDVPRGTPIYAGPGETADSRFLHLFSQGTIDAGLAGHDAVREWAFTPDPAGKFAGVIDVFGDASVWALYSPGHTPGSTAYLVRTPKGPVLLTGDVSHTAWGWDNGVEPGFFSSDQPTSAESLARLRALAAAHPKMEVRLGHQPTSTATAGKQASLAPR